VPAFVFDCPLLEAVWERLKAGTDESWWNLGKNDQFFAHLPTFCPLLKTRFGHQKPSIYAGLRAQSPFAHPFS